MRIGFFKYLILPVLLFVSRQSHTQVTNPCGVVASIYPATQDSVLTLYSSVNFINTSTNATSVLWLLNGSSSGISGNSWNYNISPGVHVISLVAYNGNCTDTTTVVYFYAGTAHNVDTLSLAHYGTSRYNEEATCIDKTLDSGFVAAGVQYPWDQCGEVGVVVKMREEGCIDWSRKLLSPYPCHDSKISAIHASSDSNFYLLMANRELVKIDKNGNFLWSKKYLVEQWQITGTPCITGDPQGNLYLAFQYGWFSGWNLIKLNNNGNVVWNKYFNLISGPPSPITNIFTTPSGILWHYGKIYVSGNIYYSSSTTSYSYLTKIDPVDGTNEWQYQYVDPEYTSIVGFVHLSSYDTLLMASTGAQGHIVTLIDPQGNVKKSIRAQYPITTSSLNYGPKKTKAVANQNGRIFLMQWTEEIIQSGNQYYTHFGEIDTLMNKYGGMQFEEYSRPWFTDITMGLKNQPAAVGTHYGFVADAIWASRDIRVLKIDSMIGTGLYCYGSDNSYTVLPRAVDRSNLSYQANTSLTVETQPGISYSAVNAYLTSRNTCPDFVDSCSYIKLSGPKELCSFNDTYTYKIHRNRKCILIPQFQLPAGVVVMNQTDSTISLKFPAFGVYTISTTLNACTPLKDSLTVRIISKSYPLDLGNDTTICAGTTIKLRAAKNFFSYLWNDGSTDSVLNITSPGLYWVETVDSCSNVLRDSIAITSFYLPITIGPDRTKCNNDTLHLNGPSGFISYEWSNNYNITSTSTQNTVVNPLVDTTYYLKAEKLPGCFSYDTVRVAVLNSPPIDLGADTAFCTGDSLLLNAGTGFNQYQWNNGVNTQQYFVTSTGAYSVIGITQQGCKSFDTLRITNLLPLPIVSLDQDNALCIGDTRLLNAGNGFSSYAWNTGSISPTILVSGLGQYIVSVIDNNGCKGNDTTSILLMIPKPSGFLGPDTAICTYGEVELKSISRFDQYNWSTGSASSSILIKQPASYWLQVKDANGCIGKDTIIVNPKQCLQGFFMPSGFTPNNDGKNDLLKPILLGDVVQYKFWIYNRWGEFIFETNDLTKGWNGTYKGQPQNSGVFVWLCNYQFEGEIKKQEKGTVVLIR